MRIASRLWNLIVAVVVAAVPAAIAAYATLAIYERGPIPEKRVELQMVGPFDPVAIMALVGGSTRVDMTFSLDGKVYGNIAAWNILMQNAGNIPILPGDVYGSIAVSMPQPWSVISINDARKNDVDLLWTRKDERTLVAQPVLINPGDGVEYTLFVTDTKYDPEKKHSERVVPAPKVTARIANMRGFSESVSRLENIRFPVGIVVYIDGWGVPFTLLIAGIFLTWYLVTLRESYFLRARKNWALALTVAAALLAVSVAEVFTYYIFGGYPLLEMLGRMRFDWELEIGNWFVLALHSIASAFLYYQARVARQARDATRRRSYQLGIE